METLLGGKTKLTVSNTEDGVMIALPSAAPDKISSTVVLKVKGALNVN